MKARLIDDTELGFEELKRLIRFWALLLPLDFLLYSTVNLQIM